MTTAEPSREDVFIDPFLSAYEGGDWAGAEFTKPDAIDRTKPAVDKLAIRNDGRTLAIEHTIIEPFVGEKEDFAFFEAALLAIEADQSLAVPGRFIRVFIPVGVLKGQSQKVRDEIAKSAHEWIRSNRLAIADGCSQAQCEVAAAGGNPPFKITLTVKAVPLKSAAGLVRGSLHVRRQQIQNNLCNVIKKALRRKLPKLVNTKADKRILMLERQHMNLLPEMMLEEIEKVRSSFSELARVDEIWILETPSYGTSFGGTCFRFERYEGGKLVEDFDFNTGV
jgi:hypothetical protein